MKQFSVAVSCAAALQACSPSWNAGDPVPAGHRVEKGMLGERYVVSPTKQRFNGCMGGSLRGGTGGAGAEALLILPIYLLGAVAVCGIVAEVDTPASPAPSAASAPAEVPPPETAPGTRPKCGEVGGYEAYKARTGEVCTL
jgi:hypothetical protein